MQMPIVPNNPDLRRRRIRPIPVRVMVPNVITLLAICARLTAIRLSTEGRIENVIAFLMISHLPVFSGKSVRLRVLPEMVPPAFVSVIFFIALLVSYRWCILSAGSLLYLASLPLGWKVYRDHQRKAVARSAMPVDVASPEPAPPLVATTTEFGKDDRPRLN